MENHRRASREDIFNLLRDLRHDSMTSHSSQIPPVPQNCPQPSTTSSNQFLRQSSDPVAPNSGFPDNFSNHSAFNANAFNLPHFANPNQNS